MSQFQQRLGDGAGDEFDETGATVRTHTDHVHSVALSRLTNGLGSLAPMHHLHFGGDPALFGVFRNERPEFAQGLSLEADDALASGWRFLFPT